MTYNVLFTSNVFQSGTSCNYQLYNFTLYCCVTINFMYYLEIFTFWTAFTVWG